VGKSLRHFSDILIQKKIQYFDKSGHLISSRWQERTEAKVEKKDV
jgi:hypothetical protein